MAGNFDKEEFVGIFHHVFLPPQLPQKADDKSDIPLLRMIVTALSDLQAILPRAIAIGNALEALKALQIVNSLPDGAISEPALSQRLEALRTGQVIPVHVRSQNAAIMITCKTDQVVFEEFELSPANEAVMTTKGRLIRTFPGLAVAVDAGEFKLTDLASTVGHTLATMCQQPVPEMQPQSKKAGSSNDELRDTTMPAAVSELFFGFLRGFGQGVPVTGISKNTREEVLWKDAKAPWRRSPMWLLIRIVLQLNIERSSDGSRSLYKEATTFVMAQVLKTALQYDVDSEAMYIMSAKIVRRLHKSREAAKLTSREISGAVEASINDVLQQASSTLADRWKVIQLKDGRELDLAALSLLDFEADTHADLPELEKYIMELQSHQDEAERASFSPSSALIKHSPDTLPRLPSSNSEESCYATANLQQFEQWISTYLDRWVLSNLHEGTCEALYQLMLDYHRLATEHYTRNPEATSVMLLTMFELWIACDRVAVSINPLLAEYNPEIPPGILQDMLLPFYYQMERLVVVESYLENRAATSPYKHSTMLFETHSAASFAIRFFDQSASHQGLLAEIQQQANQTRLAKRREFETTKSEYHEFNAIYSQTSCAFFTKIIDRWTDPPETEQQHAHDCKKCLYKRKRDALKITVHEWPLPHDPREAKAIVFEADVPPWLSFWRDARLFILQDVLKGECDAVESTSSYRLSQTDPHLSRQYFRGSRSHRVDLLSVCKPFTVSHYREKKMTSALLESDVCVANGLRYKYYDATSGRYIGNLEYGDSVARSCTYTLSNKQLQDCIFRQSSSPDGSTPNTVIANQDTCPDNMTLEEFKDLASIPLGHHIQWANMMVQLAMPSVDFKKVDTTLVFLQCIYQTGPPNGEAMREAHSMFRAGTRVGFVLEHVKAAIERIKQNWESAQALSLFVAILTRTLSLHSAATDGRFQALIDSCIELLTSARKVALGWMFALRDRAHAATEEKDRNDAVYMSSILASTANTSALVQSCIVVQQGENVDGNGRQHLRLLHLRYQRLLHRSYAILAQCQGGLDDAVRNSWSAYEPGNVCWAPVSNAAEHWLETETATGLKVHYNALDGELLVNGMPLDQPPRTYRDHPLYRTLFGRSVVEVMPASTAGFQFSTKRVFEGCRVELSMRRSRDGAPTMLTVRVSCEDGVFETVPGRLLIDAYPSHFVTDYVHWYHYETGKIQFRPLQSCWKSRSAMNWNMARTGSRSGWQLSQGRYAVAGLQSATSRAISDVLEPLAEAARIHCILHSTSSVLEVDIPAAHLGFSLPRDCSDLRSKEFRKMAVDGFQSIGTLVGLQNRLLLRSDAGERLLLIPESGVSYTKLPGHISVSVDRTMVTKVYALRVDCQLDRLVDNGDLQCKLYIAYLHALTSFCLTDPFTHRTGTEQSLSILTSSAVRSFAHLSQANCDMLAKIADVSPGRRFYPEHKSLMQSVSWDQKLHSLSQHPGLRVHVQEIFHQAEKANRIFQDVELCLPHLTHVDEHLQNRDVIRTSSFRIAGFGAEDHCVDHDSTYRPRDRSADSEKSTNATTMSGLVYRNGDDIHWEVPNADRLWQAMGSLDQIKGYMLRIEPSEMRYDAGYIHEGLNFILARLPAIHRSLGKLQDPPQRKFAIMAWLCAMAFPLDEAGCCIVQALAMFYKTVHVIGVQPPTAELFSVQEGRNCSAHTLSQIGQSHRRDYRYCPEYQLGRLLNEKRQVYENRRHHAWQSASDSAVASFVNALEIQWPREVPFVSSDHIAWTYIEVDKAMIDIRRKFKAWHDNKTLYEFLEKLVCEMRRCEITPFRAPELTEVTSARMASVSGYTPVDQLFSVPAPQLPDSCSEIDMHTEVSAQSGDPHLLRLHSLLSPLELSVGTSQYERRYTTNLRASLHALLEKNRNGSVKLHTTAKGAACYLEYCERHVSEVYHILNNTAIHSCRTFSAGGAQLLPRFSPLLLLQQLSHAKWGKLPDSWKRVIVHYGVALTALQRAQQIVELTRSDQQNGLVKELSEAGHTNWIPYDRPESLLIEVESGIRIRPVQEDIGKLMCSPPSSSNAVMQLNMGQGKSSVIVPMIAAVLANEERLIRVIVAKPQSKQMAQMLIAKLGGLVNRRVYHLPISRSLRLDIVGARAVDDLLHDCMMNRGVLLVQPEHILSFRLMVLESYITGKEDLGRQLTKTQDFLDHRARDIVDESDENFNVRFELIYTMGSQKSIELGGNRWSTIQQVLNLVKSLAPMVAEEHPGGLELLPGSHGGFARIRILHADVGTVLVSCVARQICEKGLDGLHFSRLTETLRKAIFRYITQIRLSDAEKNAVEGTTFWSTTTSSPLLLLRGILACGVLEFALSQKRWRVNYGLTTRTPPTRLAVPYLAKDSPSPRSEFSHPDVVIMLTSLCYYYQGLENEDLFIALAHLIESDQAANKYQAWVKDAVNLPNAFSQLQGVNLEDRPQCVSELFPALRHGKSVVDYYLSHIVFPKEMKEFPHKLSASGWDIGKQRTQLMTGFSGTNDSGCLLPLDVKQCDIAGQKHTNALVLEQLLQDGNSVDLMVAAAGESLNANCLLASITKLKPPVQVVLDVGAQIIDLNNLEVAKAWLKLSDSSKEAVVFLNDADDLCVIDRKDRIDQLQTSSFATRLDVCLVFLDESHTRGIDLKLPVDYRAAVTLGANLTKDRLVQACMRMRELGQGQTVIFCIPIEIQDKIMAAMNDKKGNITVLDVLQWSICETHTEMRRGMPLWLVQGQRFIRQQRLWQQATQDGTITLSKSHAELFLENEALSIDQRYRPRPDPSTESSVSPAEDPSSQLMIDRRREFGNLDFGASTLQEEQERELSPEIEQERQVQKAPPASPAVHQLHPDVKQFALQGVLKRDSKAHTTAFESLHGLSFANQCKLSELAGEGNLLVSTDFYTTIDTGGAKGACDAFQRHVSWLLTTCAPGDSKTIDSIMIISPYEANLLHPLMATSPSALHLYKPRTNSAFTALDDLAFYTISANNASPPTLPRALAVQLNLFAGQLYLDCYADYTETCRFLGLSTQRLTQSLEDAGWRVDAEGFILSDDKGRVGGSSGVTRSPVRFLKSFLSTIRRHGEVISGTQVGGLLDGKLFGPEEWES